MLADEHLLTATPDEYLQPDELSAKHAQLFVLDLLYVLIAQQNFPRTTTKLAASAMAVLPHRRPLRKQAAPLSPRAVADAPKGTGTRASGTPRASADRVQSSRPHAPRSERTYAMADLIGQMTEETTSRIERIAENARAADSTTPSP